MARLTTRQSDNFMYQLAKPIIDKLSSKLGYQVYVYYPGLDAPRVKNKQQVFIEFDRQTISKEPLGISANSSFYTSAELRARIHATEKQSDFNHCADTADEFVKVFSRRRCGYDIVIMSSRWEDTEPRDGRRIFTIVIDYKYES